MATAKEQGLTERVQVEAEAGQRIEAVLRARTGLSAARLKEAAAKGALWLSRQDRRGRHRCYDPGLRLRRGDKIELFFDPALLSVQAPAAVLLDDKQGYSVWHKPAGLMTQGNDFGDHASLLRQVELLVAPARRALLVHRLDREAAGLVLVAHAGPVAAALAERLRLRQVDKRYRVQVTGDARASLGEQGDIKRRLDGKDAHSRYRVLEVSADARTSVLEVQLITGRRHQIRRHLEAVGHPVVGDPRYGRGNKNREGLRLVATRLALDCPLSHRPVTFALPPELVGF